MVKSAAEQVEQHAALKDGWGSGQGLAPTAEALETARFLAARIGRVVHVCPTVAGGFLIENEYFDGGVEIGPDGTFAWW